MNCSNCQGYVFSENKRIVVKWIVPFISFLGCCFSISCLRLAVTYSENRSTHILISVLAAFFSCIQILARKKVMPLFSLQYICKHHAIYNVNKHHNSFADTQASLFISKIYVESNTKIPWSEHFYALSNKPFAYIANHQGNGMRVVQSLIENGVVVLPLTQTTSNFIEEFGDNINIPVYPKVAYIQKQ